MKRISNWESAFSEYIESKRNTPYEYGTNDCCMFAAGSVEAITGEDPMSEFRGKYKSLATSVRALQEIGAGDLETEAEALAQPHPRVAQRQITPARAYGVARFLEHLRTLCGLVGDLHDGALDAAALFA